MPRFQPLLIALLALALWSALPGPQAARAADLRELVDQLASDDFDEKATAVEALGVLGDGKAIPVLRALSDGTLYATTDKHAVFAEQDGDNYKLTDPIDGSDRGTATDDDIDKVRVNNRLRSAVARRARPADPAQRQARRAALGGPRGPRPSDAGGRRPRSSQAWRTRPTPRSAAS